MAAPSEPYRRRKRYSGTHPRRFAQRYKELDPDRFPRFQEHIRAQGRTPAGTHVPILVAEVLAALRPRPGETAVDCTLGYGGHAEALLRAVAPNGRLLALDVDGAELERTAARLAARIADESLAVTFAARRSNFAGLPRCLADHGAAAADAIFADLGASSMQLDDPARGFSYKHDGPLDMRMDPRVQRTAADWLRLIDEAALAAALHELADEPLHREIAAEIARRRRAAPLTRTGELSELVARVARGSRPAGRDRETAAHPAARTFLALRILVNDELAALRELLRVAPGCLRPGGRLALLTFHGGEDRLVKRALADGLAAGAYAEVAAQPERPAAGEVRDNPRAAAAKLRWAVAPLGR